MKQFLLIFLLLLPNIACALGQFPEDSLDYTLEVSFDIQASKIKGITTIPLRRGQEISLVMGELTPLDVSLDKERLDLSVQGGILRIHSSREGKLRVGYEGVFREPFPASQGAVPGNIIGGRGIFLTEVWYPKPDQMCRFHLTATLPRGYEAISEAETIEKSSRDGRTVFAFDFPHPVDGINLVASDRYKIARDHFDGVEIFAYFFPEDTDLIRTYIDQSKHYLELYTRLIDKFPYKRFSIVENFLPTGYSMPTYTLLGQQVVRLPFIPGTSLGHEILHQWFGNLAYINDDKGNWAEGLTTFLADHLYEDEKHQGPEYRKGVLINYQSYVNPKNEFPLTDFRVKTDEASEAIGYGKALMVFQMLKDKVGGERFYESIRSFVTEMRWKRASWNDIQRAFEKHCQEDLTWFFSQWIAGKGLPEILLREVETQPLGANFALTFTIVQAGKAYVLDLPVTVYSYGQKTERVFHVRKEKERFEMVIKNLPVRMVIDEDYKTARRLSPEEFPPVIARLMGDENLIMVLPPSGLEIYAEIARKFRERGAKETSSNRISFEDLKTHSLVILGTNNPLVEEIYGSLATKGGFSVRIKENPWNHSKVAGIFDSRSKEEVNAAFPKIFHYGKYSALSFDRGANILKRIDGSGRGITKALYEEPTAVALSALNNLPGVMDRVADKRIIYVGETHDQFSNHVMELEIIKDLHRRGKRIAIGMEMFQRPFQEVVDRYIEGKISEKEFLKGTQYFKRWGFDYQLYRPIMLFAREKKIPVVALNQKQEIVDKVFRGGLEILSEDEKNSVPSQMDFSDRAYQERLEKVFEEHKDSKPEKSDFFYQAQILWDETMAESIDQFLRAHPNDQVVVLAGSGHLEYGSGIPKRAFRRNGHDYAIILNDVDLKKGIADFLLSPPAVPELLPPKLMVLLKEEAGKVEITGFPPGSVSEKAGLKVGDVILTLDYIPMHTVDDVKIELLAWKKGEKIKVRVLRKGLLGGNEMDFEVTL